MRVALFTVESLEHHGPTTIAVVRTPAPEELARLGMAPVNPGMPAVTGTGISRCRAGDHYDRAIGDELAVNRAMADAAAAAADLTAGMSVTEEEHLEQPFEVRVVLPGGAEVSAVLARRDARAAVRLALLIGGRVEGDLP